MPIAKFRDTKPRFARLGKLRKGNPKGTNRPGEDLKWFRFDSEREEIQKAFEGAYGPEPASLSVYLPHVSIDENFSTWQELWTAGAMQHRCDGEQMYDYRDGDGKLHHDDPPTVACPYASGDEKRSTRNPGCKPIGRLEVVLPELLKRGFVGTVTFETHSLNDIGNILGALKATAEARGADPQGLRGIEFTLYRQPEEISMWDDAKQKHVRREKWLCKIAPAATWVQMQLSLASAQAMGGEVNEALALPAPADDGETTDTSATPTTQRQAPPADRTEPGTPKDAKGGKKGAQGAKATRKGADPGPPPPSSPATGGRELTTRVMAFGRVVMTGGVTQGTFTEIMNVSVSLAKKKLLSTDGVIGELQAMFPEAYIMLNGERKYSRSVLTEPEGQQFLARLKAVDSKVKRGTDHTDPPDDGQFTSDARED